MGDRRKFQVARLSVLVALRAGLLVVLSGCLTADNGSAPAASSLARARTHQVTSGETVYHIAHEYGVTTNQLMAANRLTRAQDLYVGEILLIPGPQMTAASAMGVPDVWFIPRADRQFAWPATGVVSSPFGIRHGVMHDGIDISAPAGTPVRAADDGRVIFSGRLHGYGNVVIIQHSAGYLTVYGHNQRNLVSEGEHVTSGREIAELGSTGRASGPNLHFEVRYNNHPQNPLAYLPPPETAGVSFARNSAP